MQLKNFADVEIRTTDLWCRKRPLCQLRHNNGPSLTKSFWFLFFRSGRYFRSTSSRCRRLWQLRFSFPTFSNAIKMRNCVGWNFFSAVKMQSVISVTKKCLIKNTNNRKCIFKPWWLFRSLKGEPWGRRFLPRWRCRRRMSTSASTRSASPASTSSATSSSSTTTLVEIIFFAVTVLVRLVLRCRSKHP